MNSSWIPDRKVLAGGLASVIAWAIILAAGRAGLPVTPDLQPLLVTAVGMAFGYLVPPSKQDILKRLNDDLVRIAQNDPNIPVTKPAVPVK